MSTHLASSNALTYRQVVASGSRFSDRGEFVIEYRGEIVSSATCMARMETIYKTNRNHYFLNYGQSEVIDWHVKGTKARYINHLCEPNCHIEKWMVNGEYQVGTCNPFSLL